tara:strand:+ start:1175 stop:1702 length:528 start_codon:yes stop_codon:yes gene_type:complete
MSGILKVGGVSTIEDDSGTPTIQSGVTQKVQSFSAYVSSQVQMSSDNTWYEVSALGTWTERWDSGQFASGRFTPTKSGMYLCGYTVWCDQLDDGEYLHAQIRKNGSTSSGDVYGYEGLRMSVSSDLLIALQGTGLVTLNGSSDYVSLYARHNQGQTATYLDVDYNEFWATYVGEI